MEIYTNFTYYDIQQDQIDFYLFNNYTQSINLFNSNANQALFFSDSASSNNYYSLKALVMKIFIGIILYSLTIWTIIGNIFVWIALFTNKQLKQGGMSNYLIGNLALSDLLLGLTVLPFSATFSTLNNWVFGKFLCDIWLSIDVLCCTASIWGLLVIAIDRYIATNHPIVYRKQKNSLKIAIIYCTIAWIVSLAISIPPFVHDLYSTINEDESQKSAELATTVTAIVIANSTASTSVNTPKFKTKIISKNLKLINDDYYECVLYYKPSFVIASSMGSFYFPLILMILLYAKVFIKIKQQSSLFKNNSIIKKKSQLQSSQRQASFKQQAQAQQQQQQEQTKALYECDHQQTKISLLDESKCKTQDGYKNGIKSSSSTNHRPYFLSILISKTKRKHVILSSIDLSSTQSPSLTPVSKTVPDLLPTSQMATSAPTLSTHTRSSPTKPAPQNGQHHHHHPASISRSEARITKTLAIIICCFILCWAPFFTAYIVRSQLSDANQISPMLMDIFIWLGYLNSSLNPILYAILNNNFRTAFKDILSCKCFKKFNKL